MPVRNKRTAAEVKEQAKFLMPHTRLGCHIKKIAYPKCIYFLLLLVNILNERVAENDVCNSDRPNVRFGRTVRPNFYCAVRPK